MMIMKKKINDRKAMTTNTITTIKRIIFDGKNENFSEQVKQTERKQKTWQQIRPKQTLDFHIHKEKKKTTTIHKSFSELKINEPNVENQKDEEKKMMKIDMKIIGL